MDPIENTVLATAGGSSAEDQRFSLRPDGQTNRVTALPFKHSSVPAVLGDGPLADGGLKRHAKAIARELQMGAAAPSNLGFHGAAPIAQGANANHAAATDLASVITLASELRAARVESGLLTDGA